MKNSLKLTLSDKVIGRVLHIILDKLDKQPILERSNKISVLVNKKNFPELFSGDEFIEEKIQELITYSIFELKVASKKRYEPLVEQNAKLIFNSEYEEMLREYYHREVKIDPWIEALNKYDFSFDYELKKILLQKPIKILGKSSDDIVKRLIEWAKNSKKGNSSREESGRCFWGISKIFDVNEELRVYFSLELLPITLLIHSHSSVVNKVIFIENLETFYQSSDSKSEVFTNTLLIYASGFKASAKRVRHRSGSKIFFSPDCHLSEKNRLLFFSWFYKEIESDISVYFWGDLDYAGMHILKALKISFPTIDAWRIGYDPMVKSLDKGFGHTPKMANKEKQYEVDDFLGCSYADEVLIPLLWEKGIFLDQEFVDIEELEND